MSSHVERNQSLNLKRHLKISKIRFRMPKRDHPVTISKIPKFPPKVASLSINVYLTSIKSISGFMNFRCIMHCGIKKSPESNFFFFCQAKSGQKSKLSVSGFARHSYITKVAGINKLYNFYLWTTTSKNCFQKLQYAGFQNLFSIKNNAICDF